jgi:hypothetical protein
MSWNSFITPKFLKVKLNLLTNATVVDDAIRFIADRSKDKETPKSSANDSEHDKEESKEPDYDEDQDQLEEVIDETREITTVTTNHVF